MPRSSRHKSSKHREYSDSEKDFCLKEKKGRGDDGGSNTSSRQLKDSASTEKRKSDYKPVSVTDVTMKDLSGGGVLNIDYGEEYSASSSSSKKRKEKEDDDRWTGGDNNEHDLSKSDSKKSSRREESLVAGVDGEEGKRSGIKVESKHHRSERKERGEKEGGSERDRKGVKSERLNAGVTGNEIVGNEGNRKQGSGEDRGGKDGVGNTDYNMHEEFHNPDAERELDRRVRRRRDGSGDGEKRQEGVRELDGRRLSSKEDMIRSEKYKDEGHKEERTRDRYQEDVDKDIWHPDLKQRDNRATKEYTSGRSEEKHLKNEKKDLDVSQTKSKPLGSEYERESERDRDRDHERERGRNRDRDRSRHDRDRERDKEHDDREHDLERDRDRERDLERVHERERERELDRDRERGRDRDRERYHRERDRDRIRDRDHNHDRLRDREYDHEYGSHVDDKGSRYKDDRVRRSSPDVYDDYYSDKSRRVELEVDKERSLSRKSHVDSVVNSSRRRTSPNSRAYTDKYRDGIQDDTKFGDSSRDVPLSETVEKIPKYRSGEKRTKFEENHVGDLSERSPSAKASPAGLKDRSPSTSVDRRFQNRSGRRRSLDVDEVERKSSSSNDLRDISVNEDRLVRDFNSKKSTGEEYPPVESPFHHKSSQGNVSSHVAGPPGFRTGADSPSFMGSLGVDTRGHSGSRYRRSVDPNVGRMPGNAWKNAPNWPSPIPNGFLPFPPGPPGPHHGGFPPMLSQYPPLFGVRPSLDMNHPGMPYHMSDDRFSGHVRPIGWQSMVDGPVPHFHGWDANNSVLRDEHSMYGPGHLPNPPRRDINAEMWKPNGDANMDLAPLSQKDVHTVKGSMDDASSAQGASRANVDGVLEQASSHKMNTSSEPSSTKEIPMTPAKVTTEKTPESSSVDDTVQLVRAYLAKLDISIDLADPELYNQFINLAVKGQSELSEEVELEYIEEKVVADSEIVNLSMGLKYFPVAKESIFKKAMNLYKADSTRRSSFEMLNGETLHTPNALGHEAEQIFVQKEKTDSPVDRTVKKEESIPEVPETLSRTHVEGKEPVSLTIDGLYNGVPFQSADLALDPIDQGQTPALKLDEMDERKLAKEFLPAESAYVDALEPTTDVEIVGNDGKRGVVESAASDELLDVAVSGPLDLSHDSVKVCEALMSVSNESDSVILSRIHHAPESTH